MSIWGMFRTEAVTETRCIKRSAPALRFVFVRVGSAPAMTDDPKNDGYDG